MSWQAWTTLAVVAGMLVGLMRSAHLADVWFLAGLSILALAGVVTPAEALAGFANPAMITVAALFVVATGLRETGALEVVARRFLGPPTGQRRSLWRLLTPTAAMSAFLNNTTIVAMALPVVLDWCRTHRRAASRFLIPLSYAAIAGGVCTLIGTSTNLVVHGLMLQTGTMRGLGFFEIGLVGVPLAVLSLVYLTTYLPGFLPDRREFLEQLGAERREYLVEMRVEPSCPFVGRRVIDAGLRHLPGLFLVEIGRGDDVISPVGPDERILGGDRLVFVGVVSTVVDLQKTRGLVPVSDDPAADFLTPHRDRHLCEAVVSASSPVVGRGIREANFRTVYDAAVIAVHRNGTRLAGKIGDIVVQPGDTLLLQTGPGFVRAHRNDPDFYLISEVGGSEPVRHEKAGLAVAILGALVLLMAAPEVLECIGAWPDLARRLDGSRALFAVAAAAAMVWVGCVTASAARRSVHWDVLLVIAASFGISAAIQKSGLADAIVDAFMPLATRGGPVAGLAIVYLLGLVLTELLTNNAAAALTFPVAVATAARLGLDPRPFAIAVAMSASGGFMTPMGYQTHMMVFGPGGYRLGDFVRAGLPLNVLWFVVSVLLIPLLWPLEAAK